METQLERIKDKINDLFKREALQKEKPVVGKRYFLDNTGAATGTYVGLNEKYRQSFKDIKYTSDEYGHYSLDEHNWVTFAATRNLKPVGDEQ